MRRHTTSFRTPARVSPAQDAGRRVVRSRRRPWTAFLLVGLLAMVVGVPFAAGQPEPLTLPRSSDPLTFSRHDMVEKQVRRHGVSAPDVLSAMQEVPRHMFVPESARDQAYDGRPLTFAPGKTLSQAYLSGRMIELLQLDGDERVLEIGTGSGYDAALLSRVSRVVHTVEIDAGLARRAERVLRQLGYTNVHVHVGDGYRGLPEKAPFDAILLTTAPPEIPELLLEQLRVGGRMVVATGDVVQDLQVITKTPTGREIRRVSPVRLGEMTGEAQEP